MMKKISKLLLLPAVILLISGMQTILANEPFTPEDLLQLKSVGSPIISPDGSEILYTVSTPRTSNDKPGGSQSKYYRMKLDSGESIPLFTEDAKGSRVKWSPDGRFISFISKDDSDISQVFAMPVLGGEVVQLTKAINNVSSYAWNPNGNGLAYLSRTPKTAKEKELDKRGYDFIFYEENLKNNNLFVITFDENFKQISSNQLTKGVMVWDFIFNHQGSKIAATISPKNLIDQRYMFRKINVIDVKTGKRFVASHTKGKLGNYAFSPDDKHLAYLGAYTINDHQNSQLYVVNLKTNKLTNLTPENFRGHSSWVGWKNNKELFYMTGEGVFPKLSLVSIKNGKREIILDAAENGLIFRSPSYTKDFDHFVFSASSPDDPGNLYYWNGKDELKKITDINPQLADKTLAKQEVIHFNARDGVEIEGVLMYPVGYQKDTKYPLILYVHGGPEAHHSNGWLSRYSTPGQVMANKGYLVLYLNYRASTGYGVDFAMAGFMDPAGVEFDDLADGIDYMVKDKGADRERVGMAGGSYGGYASAWFATYYTKYVKAVCMFVGISNNISRRGTTDIAWEELLVHSGEKLEKQWQKSLKTSPIYWAHQSKTATLIYGGAADTRVHPSQSMELYRRMKMNDHPAVRLVQYPGEGHGNRKQVGQIDVLYRQIEWLDWYVKDKNPLDGPMPRLDISDRYGLDWKF